MSDDKPVETSAELRAKLAEMRPTAPADRCFSSPSPSVSVDETTVSRAVRSFPVGFRPQQLLDLINNREGGAELLSALTVFVNMLLKGRCNPEIVPNLFSGRLIALIKAPGGIRPTIVGCTLRRLT